MKMAKYVNVLFNIYKQQLPGGGGGSPYLVGLLIFPLDNSFLMNFALQHLFDPLGKTYVHV